jgi:hypothetical protein
MFIIKAEVRSEVGPANYSLFQAERVRVCKSMIGSQGPTRPAGADPEIEVWLYDQQNNNHEVLYVGHGIDQFCAVFIMNERGKTVDSVYPGPVGAQVMPRAA